MPSLLLLQVLKEKGGDAVLGGVAVEYSPQAGPNKFMVGTEQGLILSGNRKAKNPQDRIVASYPGVLGLQRPNILHPCLSWSSCRAGCMRTQVLEQEAGAVCPDSHPRPCTCRRPPLRHLLAGAQPPLPQVLPLHRRLDSAHLERGPANAHHDHQVPRSLPHRRRLEPHAVCGAAWWGAAALGSYQQCVAACVLPATASGHCTLV